MATRKAIICFSCPAEQVWQIVTDLSHTAWRSDLARVEVLDALHFVEYTKSGYATRFAVTVYDPPRRWAFSMESDNMTGSWEGIFEPVPGGVRLTCTETVLAKRRWMRPLVPGYLKRQQRRYLDDLRREICRRLRCT